MMRRAASDHLTLSARAAGTGALILAAVACGGGDPTTPTVPTGSALSLTVSGLMPLDPAVDGHYQAWVVDRAGAATSLGTIDPGNTTTTFTNSEADVVTFLVGMGAAGMAAACGTTVPTAAQVADPSTLGGDPRSTTQGPWPAVTPAAPPGPTGGDLSGAAAHPTPPISRPGTASGAPTGRIPGDILR